MAKKYYAVPKNWSDDYEYMSEYHARSARSIEIHTSDDPEPVFIGLLDQDGDPLFSFEPRQPIGFVIFDDDQEEKEQIG